MTIKYSAEQIPLPVSHDRDSADTIDTRLTAVTQALETFQSLEKHWSELSKRERNATIQAISDQADKLQDLAFRLNPEEVPRQLGRFGAFQERILEYSQTLTGRSSIAFEQRVRQMVMDLENLLVSLDPVAQPKETYNPGSPSSFAEAIIARLNKVPRNPLETLVPFYGSGIYTLYYSGDFPAYTPISDTEIPIYVGKAEPDKLDAVSPREQGKRLFKRLWDHRDSIQEAANHEQRTLMLEQFSYRYLVLDSAWQGVAENLLIRKFKPIWNKETKICQGLGKNGDSADTRKNGRSEWDTLHPGRKWATTANNKPNRRSPEQIIERILEHCATHYSETDTDAPTDLV